MAETKLSKNDFELLLRIVKEQTLRNTLEKVKPLHASEKSPFVIRLELNDIQALLDALTYALTDIGLDEASEPNEVGLKINGLIDKFAKYVY